MVSPGLLEERRKHPRAQLRVPARIRWRGPLGMRLEIARTLDVCRSGLLVERVERCEVRSQVWVISPFDSRAAVQPETPGRIARVESQNGGPSRVAITLETSTTSVRPIAEERRQFPRVAFALPIFVRPADSPWPEESMTMDLSAGGARFSTSRIYTRGDSLLARIPWGDWDREGEVRGRVTRVQAHEPLPGPAPLADPRLHSSGILTTVCVQWIRRARR